MPVDPRQDVGVALRVGPVADGAMKLVSVKASRRNLIGPSYHLANHGRFARPPEFSLHNGIVMSNLAGSNRLLLSVSDGTL